MLSRLFPLFGAVVLAGNAHAQTVSTDKDGNYALVGRWHISPVKNEPACAAVMASDEMGAGIVFDAKRGLVTLLVLNSNATSVAEAQKVNLAVVFTTGERIDDGWGETEFTASVADDGSRMFSSKPFNKQMLDDLAKQEYFMVLNGGKLVAGAKLTESAVMVRKLRECSIQAAGLNAKDPFLP